MEGGMARLKLKYVHEYIDRTGKLRRYFRKDGKKLGPLPGDVGSQEFMAAYGAYAALEKPTAIAARPMHEDSLAKLVADFYGHGMFTKCSASTRRTYRSVLEPIVREHGHRSVNSMTVENAEKILDKIGAEHPAMANLTRAAMRRVMKLAIKLKRRRDNPFLGLEPYEVGEHHTWTEAELRKYEDKWRLGTRERLAYALLLYTAQREGDVAKMHRADILAGDDGRPVIHVVQEKTGAEVWVPIHPELERAMKAYPARGLTLIGAASGRPITRFAIYKMMKSAIKEAGLPGRCVPHGLRKAALRRLAEADGTEKQIAAVSGHGTLREIQRYTKAADKKKLARQAMDKLRTKVTN
jgi:enterobacteria phage integrase